MRASAPIMSTARSAMAGVIAVVELHSPQVGQKEDIGGGNAYLKRRCQGRILDGGPLGSNAESHALRLGGQRQPSVDLACLVGPAGHRRDQQGGSKGGCPRNDRPTSTSGPLGSARWVNARASNPVARPDCTSCSRLDRGYGRPCAGVSPQLSPSPGVEYEGRHTTSGEGRCQLAAAIYSG